MVNASGRSYTMLIMCCTSIAALVLIAFTLSTTNKSDDHQRKINWANGVERICLTLSDIPFLPKKYSNYCVDIHAYMGIFGVLLRYKGDLKRVSWNDSDCSADFCEKCDKV